MRFDRITSRLSAVLSKMSGLPGLSGLTLPSAFSANGGIPIVYKGIVVTVMAIVASGTLVTFGTAGAEEVPMARSGAQIPAASEANPIVEGQALPAGLDPSIFASSPLLSTIDLTDASAADFSSLDDDDDDSNSKNKNKHNKHKKPVTKKPVTKKTVTKKVSNNTTTPGTGNSGDTSAKRDADEKAAAEKAAKEAAEKAAKEAAEQAAREAAEKAAQEAAEKAAAQKAYDDCVRKWGILHASQCKKP